MPNGVGTFISSLQSSLCHHFDMSVVIMMMITLTQLYLAILPYLAIAPLSLLFSLHLRKTRNPTNQMTVIDLSLPQTILVRQN